MTARSNRLGIDPAKMASASPPRTVAEQAPEEPCPAVEVVAKEEAYERGETFEAPDAPPPVPAESPKLADLVAASERFEWHVREAAKDAEQAKLDHLGALAALDRARSAVAHRVGRGQLVDIGGALFKSVPPRKVGGVVPVEALWRLEPVEVAK